MSGAAADETPMQVHPATELFPMMTDTELDALATDIVANGLVHAVIVKHGVLIDGRNRREACRRAGVGLRVEELNGTDPVAYILAANVVRRHLTKGQCAMAIAKLDHQPTASGISENTPENSSTQNIQLEHLASKQYVSYARAVLQWLPEAADLVLAGTTSLNDAYTAARHRRRELSGVRRRAAGHADTGEQKETTVSFSRRRESRPERTPPRQTKLDRSPAAAALRHDRMRVLAAEGASSRQIAAALGYTEEACRHTARRLGIAIPADKFVVGQRRHDPNRIVEAIVTAADLLTADVNLIDFPRLSQDQLAGWVQSLKASKRALAAFIRRLHHHHHHHERTDV